MKLDYCKFNCGITDIINKMRKCEIKIIKFSTLINRLLIIFTVEIISYTKINFFQCETYFTVIKGITKLKRKNYNVT